MAVEQSIVDAGLVAGITGVSVAGTILLVERGAGPGVILTWALLPTAFYTAISCGVYALTGRVPMPPSSSGSGDRETVGYRPR